MLFDAEEFFPIIEKTKILVTGDFTMQRVFSATESEKVFIPEERETILTGASRVAQVLGKFGFDVSAVGMVNEDHNFIELQEALYTSKVDVDGLRTSINFPASVSSRYLTKDYGFTISHSVNAGSDVYSDFIMKHLEKNAEGVQAILFVDGSFRSFTRKMAHELMDFCTKKRIPLFVYPEATGLFSDDMRYFLADWIIGRKNDLSQILSSVEKTQGGKDFCSRVKGLFCKSGGVLSMSPHFIDTSEGFSLTTQETRYDDFAFFALAASVLACGYSLNQAAKLGAFCALEGDQLQSDIKRIKESFIFG